MLVLSRKIDQEILIGEDILVTVISVNGNRVKLGIAFSSRELEMGYLLRKPKAVRKFFVVIVMLCIINLAINEIIFTFQSVVLIR